MTEGFRHLKSLRESNPFKPLCKWMSIEPESIQIEKLESTYIFKQMEFINIRRLVHHDDECKLIQFNLICLMSVEEGDS